MKVFIVTDWTAKQNYAFEKDDEAIDKFRDLVFMSENNDSLSMEEFDLEIGERTTLLSFECGRVTSTDASLSGIAADMDDERHAVVDEVAVDDFEEQE